MKLVTYRSERGIRAGAVRGDAVVDVWDALGRGWARPARQPARSHCRRACARCSRTDPSPTSPPRSRAARTGPELGAVELLPPITDPQKIVCIGLNYAAHAAEAGMDPPVAPTFFAKFANALAAPGATVRLPAASDKVDYEAEVAFVIGARATDVGVEEALDHVAGYTLLNDLSARDLQFQTPQWIPGKVFDGSAPAARGS